MNTSDPYIAPTMPRSETPCSLASSAGSASDLGQHRINRKRVRHRPSRSRRHFLEQQMMARSVLPPHGQIDHQRSNSSTPMSLASLSTVDWSALDKYGGDTSFPAHSRQSSLSSCTSSSPSFFPHLQRVESEDSRDRRIFGGDDDDNELARDLRGPMLDVVLGLFNGVDYEDEDSWI